jgi:hypothetical protein
METFVEERYVYIDNVAIHERAAVGNAVADDFVDGRAYGLGEMIVVQRRRIALTVSAGWGYQLGGWERTSRSIHALCTISSISSVVTPGAIAAAAISSTSLASRHTVRMPSIPFSSKIVIFRELAANSLLGRPSAA